MRKFSRPIDLRSRREMTDYLRNHFRYSTMNSWNHATSYACNLKIYGLGLDPEIESKLYDMLDTREFLLMRQEALYLFNAVHNFRWQAGFNGRSGGYLILYQGDLKPSGYLSYCINYTSCKSWNTITDDDGHATEDINYTDGTGKLYFSGSDLCWQDNKENTGSRCRFERS